MMILSFKISKDYRGKVCILPERQEVTESRNIFVAAMVPSKANPHPERERSESLSNRDFPGLAWRFSQPLARQIEHSRLGFVPFDARAHADAPIAQTLVEARFIDPALMVSNAGIITEAGYGDAN